MHNLIPGQLRASALAVLCSVCAFLTHAAQPAQRPNDYPNRPIRIVVGTSPGGGADILARQVASKLAERWGRAVVIDNRTGAGSAVAMGIVAQASPDGYTLLVASGNTVALSTILSKVEFDVRKAYAPVSQFGSQPYILASAPSLPVSSARELIAYSKARPGGLNYATSGIGSATHLGMELFNYTAGLKMVHVPYKGLMTAMADFAQGQMHLTLAAPIVIMANIRTGRLKPLGIASLQRASFYPEVPTIAETGLPGFEWGNTYMLFAPSATPPAIVSALNSEVVQIMNTPDVKAALAADGSEAAPPLSSAQIKEQFDKNYVVWEKFIKTSGIKF